MAEGKFSTDPAAPAPEGLPGAPDLKGLAYTGPFGPAHGWQPDSFNTEMIGAECGSAHLEWGAAGVRGSRRKALRSGVRGEIAGRPLLVSRGGGGLSRERRALRIEFDDRVYAYRLRKWSEHWLHHSGEVPVIQRRTSWDGEVLEAADAWDVAVFVLIQASGLYREVELRP